MKTDLTALAKRYVPALDWGRSYTRDTFQNDMIAAVIVTIMLIPQSLAYALLAGLPPEAGLYASILPIILYAIFGTSRALAGWLGHERPFAFDLDYRPGAGIERMRVGTPPIVQMATLEAALDVWDTVDMTDIRHRSISLSERFIAGVEAACPDLTLASPRDPQDRGSQVSFHFENGYAAMQALIAEGVIGDFRAPDIMRFGFTPLYLTEADIDGAVATLARILNDRLWDSPEFLQRKAVT